MTPLFHEREFTFRFGEPRVVGRFHLEGVAPGTPVTVREWWTPEEVSGEILRTASVGPGGWVTLAEPLSVDARRGFQVTPG